MNLQPSEAEAGFDIRVPPVVDIEELETEIRTKWAPASRNLTFTVSFGSCHIFKEIESVFRISMSSAPI